MNHQLRHVGALAALLAAGLWLSLLIGPVPIGAREALRALAFPDDGLAALLVWETRLPRFALAAAAGAALGLAGALMQEALQNDLADPGLLGVSGGAGLVVAAATIGGFAQEPAALRGFALIGGTSAAAAVLAIARLIRDKTRLILIGAALSAFFAAALTVIVLVATAAQTREIYFFLVGSLIGRGWSDLVGVAPWIVAGAAAAGLLASSLALLRLGDDVAEGLGVGVRRIRAMAMAAAVVLTAPVVAHCGPIAFVALTAPHLARRMRGPSVAGLGLPLTALVGSCLLASADLVSRVLIAPAELPVGIVVTALGAPIAVALLRRRGARSFAP